jgi:hypothetical protein
VKPSDVEAKAMCMFHWLRGLGLNARIALLGVVSVLITAGTLVTLAVWQSGQYNRLAQCEVDGLIEADLDHIAQGIYNLVRAEDEAVQEQVDDTLNVARRVLADAGGVGLSPEPVVWTGINQFTEEAVSVRLPKLLIGGRWLGPNTAPDVETPVVDEVTRLVGGTATVFQRMNDRGDMLRVATTVTNKDGRRAIGTYIPAVNPDNTPNPVIAAILRGQMYHGRAFVVDAWNITAYRPIADAAGKPVGMVYVGVRQEHAESANQGGQDGIRVRSDRSGQGPGPLRHFPEGGTRRRRRLGEQGQRRPLCDPGDHRQGDGVEAR